MYDYTITLDESGDYIIIKVVGGLDRETAIGYIKDSHKLGAETGINKFLLDATEAVNVESTGDNFSFAAEELEIIEGFNRIAIVAMLVAEDDHSHDFVATVAQNAGQSVTLFRDREAAIQHLLAETEET